MQVNKSIQAELKLQAKKGARVADLVRIIRCRAGVEKPGEGRLLVSAYLTKTFGIPLDRAAEVSGWVGFGDGDGETTDDELDELLGRYLRSSSS
ncbi:hypothetical protein [Enhygromyxa salina]|uniref:hypothetical protein n=1 Tax=Enhygromyxa salina TaxID=215803 RepID=UPI0011B276E7|nr:hypothetical protein [Enhygromyxa salina]